MLLLIAIIPVQKYHIEFENTEYLRTDLGMTENTLIFLDNRDYEDINNSKNCQRNFNPAVKENILKY